MPQLSEQAELDDERERLEMIERKLNHDRQLLHRDQAHFQFRSQQDTMIKQLVTDKKDLTGQLKRTTEALVESRSSSL